MLGDVGVGMNGDRRNFEVLIHGSMVECFDVLEFVNKIVPGRWESVGGHGVEHERIIGVRAMTDSYDFISVFVHRKFSHDSATCTPFMNHPLNFLYNGICQPRKLRFVLHSTRLFKKAKESVEMVGVQSVEDFSVVLVESLMGEA